MKGSPQMKRPSLCRVSIFAIFCLSLIWLRPTQATNSQFAAASATRSEQTGRPTKHRADMTGHWLLQATGDAVDIDETDGNHTAHISGVDWDLVEEGQRLSATRILTGADPRRLFTDISDAPA